MRLEIETVDPRLASDLMGRSSPQPGETQAILGGPNLTFEGRQPGPPETIVLALTFDERSDRITAASWLFQMLSGRATKLRIDSKDIEITEKQIKRFVGPRNIILCSDGTGNAGGKSRGTNVWRLFNAVDWHNEEVQQLAFYNDGVGTDDLRLLKVLGGAFGLGLSRNLIELYSFAALNYQPGDRIYLFGFSRGAYTVRALAGMMMRCGLLTRSEYLNADRPQKLVKRILRAYQRDEHKRAQKIAALHRDFAGGFDTTFEIKFIGVWDTVDAVGVPMDELRKPLDWLSRKLLKRRLYGFHDQKLDGRVKHACQALSIDDERKTFHPNIGESRPEGGIEQVWFAGAHSNVGGGYPKDGMARVTLDWMMGKALDCGLQFDPDAREDVRRAGDVHAKLYDPRAGLGVFYRYAPRNLGEKPLIHVSVYDRITRGTARYAPIVIPQGAAWAVTDAGPYAQAPPGPPPALSNAGVAQIDRLVGLRKRLYMLFVAFSAFVAAWILLGLMFPPVSTVAEWLTWIQSFLKLLLPAALEPVVELAAHHPLQAGAVVLVLLFLRRSSTVVKRATGEYAFQAWRTALARAWDGIFTPGIAPAHRSVGWLRWLILPPPVTGALVLLVLAFVAVDMPPLAPTDIDPVGDEALGPAPVVTALGCENTRGTCVLAIGRSVRVSVRADRRENFTAIELIKGDRYEVQYVARTRWQDGSYEPPPGGFEFGRNLLGLRRFWWLEWLRPYWSGHWFQLVGRIDGTTEVFPVLHSGNAREWYEFQAAHGGELLLFVNDVPYGNNRGVMTLQLRRFGSSGA